jgi:hypothetical protein
VTREEAERESARLARESPDRAGHHWFPRADAAGDWSVVRVAIPEAIGRRGMKEAQEARARPPEPANPRPLNEQLIPPFGAGG